MRRAVDLSVVLVSWNTADLTLRALESLPRATQPLVLECICVDNGSHDDTLARIQALHPDVLVLENTGNEGFARAANRALPLLSGRYTCFLNSDTRPRADALAYLVRWLDAHPEATMAAPSLVDAQDRPHVVGRPEPTPLAMLHESTVLALGRVGRRSARAWRAGLVAEAPTAVPNIVGACLVIRTDWIRVLGGYDEEYFFYWEDTDLCRTVRQRGGGVWVVPDGPAVEHLGGASTPQGSAAYRVSFFAGQLRYVRKALPSLAGSAFAAIAVLGFWLRAWHKGPALLLRSARRRMGGRRDDARRSMRSARSWLGVIERQGPALLRLLRRPPGRNGGSV